MRKFVLSFLVATIGATAAVASPLYRDRFVDEKSGYVVETRKVGGSLRVTGHHPQSGRRFALKVTRDDRVTGTWNGQPVSFRLGESPKVELAAVAGAAAK